jgi:hypothetical protein
VVAPAPAGGFGGGPFGVGGSFGRNPLVAD